MRRDFETPGKRHLALLVSLLLLFVLSPFVITLRFGVVVVNIVGVAVLLSGTYTVSERKRLFAGTVILAASSVALSGMVLLFPVPWLILTGHVCLLLLLGLFSISILTNVLRAGSVTADRIYGAICIYLLVGYAWAFGYAIIEDLRPGSFSGLIVTSPVDYLSRVTQLRYLSFVTLTTVGYGDIVPHSEVARTFATLEAVVGQMYLAVLVARLVGLHIVEANSSQSSKEKQPDSVRIPKA